MAHPISILAVGGVDPTGHAGLAADLRAGAALNALVSPVVTALTVQDSRGLYRIQAVDADLLRQQIGVVRRGPLAAVKIGMLPGLDQARAVAEALAGYAGPVVIDPVLAASAGGDLAGAGVAEALPSLFAPLAALLTPNLLEAAALLKGSVPGDAESMKEAGAALRGLGFRAVLMKGGHLDGPRAPDFLSDQGEGLWIEGPRLDTPNTRGTGCILATLIAVLLGQGQPLRLACVGAKNALVILLRKNALYRWPQGAGPIL
ncbi:MAG: bifunctional hydroxymethylpyrimidine kinase/phosphomethylpyrimidine kinase [bacterium]